MNHLFELNTLAQAQTAHAIQGLTVNAAATLLLISPEESDHRALQKIFAGTPWTLHYAYTWDEAQECLEETPVSVVICNAGLPDGDWRGVQRGLASASRAPLLIVASRLADDRLWAEVLNFGGYDVLAKPFGPAEMKWTAGIAAWKWQQQHTAPRFVC